MGTSGRRVYSLQFTVQESGGGEGYQRSDISEQEAGNDNAPLARTARGKDAEDAEIRREEERDGNTEVTEIGTQRAQSSQRRGEGR
jgi:hypothetical protein